LNKRIASPLDLSEEASNSQKFYQKKRVVPGFYFEPELPKVLEFGYHVCFGEENNEWSADELMKKK